MLFRRFWIRLLSLILDFLFGREVYDVAIIYATLIVKGKKTFNDVPALIKNQVREILVDLDCGDLAGE